MKNSEMPISPIFNSGGMPSSTHVISSGDITGLTKREYFAGMMMQALIPIHDETPNRFPKQVADRAIAYADALLKQLEGDDK